MGWALSYDPSRVVIIDYTNWRSERRSRPVVPQRVWFGQSDYHEGPQWFLEALDCESGDVKDFALSSMHRMSPCDLAGAVSTSEVPDAVTPTPSTEAVEAAPVEGHGHRWHDPRPLPPGFIEVAPNVFEGPLAKVGPGVYRGLVRIVTGDAVAGDGEPDESHSCDDMGCSSVGDHVLSRTVLPGTTGGPYATEVYVARKPPQEPAEGHGHDFSNPHMLGFCADPLCYLRRDDRPGVMTLPCPSDALTAAMARAEAVECDPVDDPNTDHSLPPDDDPPF